MSRVFFSADCHFDHANIIKYCNRPFNTVEKMNNTIVTQWNKKVKQDDLVYHVGDFAYKGQNSAKYWQKRLNGDIVHIRGNHDKNNGVKTLIDKCMMFFGGKDVYVEHVPPTFSVLSDFCICGHVHNKWKYKIIEDDYILINVGVDVWGFEPVSINNILKLYNKIKGEIK